jgi:two-component system, NarL family, invasion response regulator UvrY
MGAAEGKTRVLIADDHRMIRNALKNILNHQPDMEIVGEAKTSGEVFLQIAQSTPDVIVLDLNMPEKDGLEILQQLRAEKNTIPVIILTLYPEERFKNSAFAEGAVAFLTKDCDPEELIAAIRKAANIRSN